MGEIFKNKLATKKCLNNLDEVTFDNIPAHLEKLPIHSIWTSSILWIHRKNHPLYFIRSGHTLNTNILFSSDHIRNVLEGLFLDVFIFTNKDMLKMIARCSNNIINTLYPVTFLILNLRIYSLLLLPLIRA